MRIKAHPTPARVDPLVLQRWMNDPGGPVQRMLDTKASAVLVKMVTDCPKRRGVLAATARRQSGRNVAGPHRDVIIGKPGLTDYLGHILRGTPPHLIRARQNRPNARLRFVASGVVVFAKEVNHPGTRANNFVVRALDAAR